MPIEGTPIDTAIIDSYVTLAEAEYFFGNQRNPEYWDDATTAEKTAVLSQAKLIIDSLPLRGTRYEGPYIENGSQADPNSDGLTQEAEFPRIIDGVVCDWDYGTDLPIIPQDIKNATFLISYALIEEAEAEISEGQLQAKGITSFSLGKLSMSFGAGAGEKYYGLPREAYNILRKYIEQTPGVL